MKKIIVLGCALAALAVSCKKDKEYGVTVKEVVGVTFPQSKDLVNGLLGVDSISVSSAFNSQSLPQTIEDIVIAVESDRTLSAPVVIQLQVDNNLVPKTTPTILNQFPAAAGVTVPTTITIPAGARFVYVPISCANASALSLSLSYAIGIKMVAVTSGNAQLAANRKDIVCTFSVKNQYDGHYKMKGFALRAGDPVLTGYFSDIFRDLITTGPNSVVFSDLLPWGSPTGGPNNTGIAIGNQSFSVDPATNLVSWGGVGGSSLLPGYTSRYVPSASPKTFYLGITWGAGPAARLLIDTLEYVGPR
jgi:hypothetical protein